MFDFEVMIRKKYRDNYFYLSVFFPFIIYFLIFFIDWAN